MAGFNSPIPERKPPLFHEGSSLRSVRDGDNNSKQWQKNQVTSKQSGAHAQDIAVIRSQIFRLRRRIVGGSDEIPARWQEPKELDPTVSVSEGTWVYISPLNDLVTVGMIDPIAGADTKSFPGIWEARQDVPAADSDNYNVPQTDYPGATGTPSGTPLKGDLDGDDVFWILICPTCGL